MHYRARQADLEPNDGDELIVVIPLIHTDNPYKYLHHDGNYDEEQHLKVS